MARWVSTGAAAQGFRGHRGEGLDCMHSGSGSGLPVSSEVSVCVQLELRHGLDSAPYGGSNGGLHTILTIY